MKLNFDHSKDSLMRAIGIDETKYLDKLSDFANLMIDNMKNNVYDTPSEIMEEMQRYLSDSEILMLAHRAFMELLESNLKRNALDALFKELHKDITGVNPDDMDNAIDRIKKDLGLTDEPE